MTDKLPESIIKRISGIVSNYCAHSPENMPADSEECEECEMIANDLRDFLAKFVLCDLQPVGHAVPSRKGDAIVMTVAALRVPSDATTPLHAPATKEPE